MVGLKQFNLPKVLGSMVCMAALTLGGAAHARTVLNAAFFQPAGNPSVELAKEVLQEIEKETEGRVQFRLFPSSTLVPTAEMGMAVDDGSAFMAIWYMPYMSKTIPLFDIETVPVWTAGTCDAIIDTYENGLNDLYGAALERQGMPNVKVAGVSMCLPRVLGTTKTQVKVPGDLKGLRIRSVAAETQMFSAIGAHPVNMTNDQVYEALSRGIVDGLTNAFSVMDEHRYLEMVKYVVNTNLTWVLTHVIYNDKALEKLQPQDREIVESGMKRLANHVRAGVQKHAENSVANAPAEYDATVHQPTDAERELWLAAAAETRQAFKARADGDALIQEGLELVRKYHPY